MVLYNKKLKPYARELRANMTQAERLLWSKVRHKQLNSIQFYLQRAIASFIVDFYAPKVKLVIELDGSQHLEEEHMECDKIRDDYLNDLGIRVMRFDNLEVILHLDSVTERILEVMDDYLKYETHNVFNDLR
ncbi:MAG: endonuclease domain-containing protein [Candidatus Berkiella sp.]